MFLQHGNTLVFVEVRVRRGVGFGDPFEAVTSRNKAAIWSLARQYLSEKEPQFEALRCDVAGILLEAGAPCTVHVPYAF